MNVRVVAQALSILGVWMLCLGAARADTVLYDGAGFIQGQQSFGQSFDITTPGTLTVSLSDIPWLDAISNLNVFLSTPSGLVGTSMASGGTESMSVQPGMIYANWFGDADGKYGVGAYGLKVTFRPAGSPSTAVPLESSLIFLATGIAVLITWRKRGALESTEAEDHGDILSA